MPRNASGVYSKPSGTTAVANTVASSSAYNTLADDIGSEITASLPRAGTAAPSANLPMGGFRHTGAGDAAATTDYLAAGQAAKGSHEWYGSTSGTNAYTLAATSFVPAALTNGMAVAFRVVNANTGAVTLAVGALAAKSVVRFDNTALASGEWPAGAIVSVRYSSDLDKFVWVGDLGNPALYGKLAANNTWAGTAAFNAAVTLAAAAAFNGAATFADQVIHDLQTLTDGASIAWDLGGKPNATVTLGGNRTLDAPTGETAGSRGLLFVVQDATGSRTLAFNAAYKFPGGLVQHVDPAASATTVYAYHVRGADDVILRRLWTTAKNSIGAWKEYDLGAYAASTNFTQGHGLGRQPAAVQAWLENTTTEFGYAVGDRVEFGSLGDTDSPTARKPGLTANTTNVIVTAPVNEPRVVNRSTFAAATITAVSWKVVVRVYE